VRIIALWEKHKPLHRAAAVSNKELFPPACGLAAKDSHPLVSISLNCKGVIVNCPFTAEEFINKVLSTS
jgi:hypothetical protein